jgi:Co/Zn/Cd efflux system component
MTDLHIWRVGSSAYSCTMALATQDSSITPNKVKEHLKELKEIAHITIEVHYH